MQGRQGPGGDISRNWIACVAGVLGRAGGARLRSARGLPRQFGAALRMAYGVDPATVLRSLRAAGLLRQGYLYVVSGAGQANLAR